MSRFDKQFTASKSGKPQLPFCERLPKQKSAKPKPRAFEKRATSLTQTLLHGKGLAALVYRLLPLTAARLLHLSGRPIKVRFV